MTIATDFKRVLAYSQGVENPIVDSYFDNWKTNKARWIGDSDDPIIYRSKTPVRFQLSTEAKRKKFNEFCADVLGWSSHIDPALNLLVRYNGEINFFDNIIHISAEDYTCIVEQHQETLSNYDFERTYARTYVRKKLPSLETLNGMKLLRAFKFFISDEERLRVIQDKASMYIQEDKVEGYFTVSVHPLDYLSSSENTYNWRSCHSLDGDYRAGNLSYMQDSVTLICYLSTEKKVKLPDFPDTVPWYSKKWRMLLHISKDNTLVFAGRQYPFMLDGALDYLDNTVLPIFIPNYGKETFGGWQHNYNSELSDYITDNSTNKTLPLSNFVGNKKGNQAYNDVLSSTIYRAHYSFNTEAIKTGNYKKILLGNSCTCIQCGDILNVPKGSATMLCSSCNDENCFEYHCDSCGEGLYDDEIYWVKNRWGDWIPYCDHCYDNLDVHVCENCGDAHYEEDMEEINDRWYCRNCAPMFDKEFEINF